MARQRFPSHDRQGVVFAKCRQLASILVCVAASLCPSVLVAQDIAVASPDGRVEFRLFTSGKGLEYAVSFRGKPVIDRSPIGIVVDGANLAEGAAPGATDRYQRSEDSSRAHKDVPSRDRKGLWKNCQTAC